MSYALRHDFLEHSLLLSPKMTVQMAQDINEAGTGFMLSLSAAIEHFEKKGYVENLVPRFDHFECRNGTVRLHVNEFEMDDMIRFENTSDPDDQAILYALCSRAQNIKGLYVDSYGLYHDELAPEMINFLRSSRIKTEGQASPLDS